jgi:hypothetical protein
MRTFIGQRLLIDQASADDDSLPVIASTRREPAMLLRDAIENVIAISACACTAARGEAA